jgi:methylated-DNA-protein-cysteine methyltransferase-like protein
MNQQERDDIKKAVFDVVQLIPYGRATSYGAIAKSIGYPHLSRLVGRIMGECSNKEIPAHRVVNSQGVLSGKEAFGDSCTMENLLIEEGVTIINNRINNWKEIFWNPLTELE